MEICTTLKEKEMKAQFLRVARFGLALPVLSAGGGILLVGIALGEATYALGMTKSNGVNCGLKACADPIFGLGEIIAGR